MKKILFSIAASLFLSGCSSLLYYPTQMEYYQIKDLPYQIEEMKFPDSSGHQIHAWYFHAQNPKAKILFFHGNAQNLTAHFLMLAWLVDNNYDLMIFDYPGYGKSTGSPTPESTVKSGVSTLEKMSTIKPDLPLFVYGQSLGGQIMQKSLHLYDKKNYRAVFIEASFTSYRSVARSVAAKNWATWILQPIAWLLMNDSWASDPGFISPTPVYVMHGDRDEVVGIEQGQHVFQKANEPKHWKVFAGGAHSNSYFIKNNFYRQYLLESLDAELKKK
ncbi:MAG: alpha/beta hydrolase [Bdellovibrionaceae bacterium]|nr:alpha/beta hydrolase [Pseudobdellovibrionaceae bacterium]